MMEKNAKIYVAGHRGMVGSAIVRELKRQGYESLPVPTKNWISAVRMLSRHFSQRKNRNMSSSLLQK